MLALVAQLDGGDSELGQAVNDLADAAAAAAPDQLEQEFQSLFIGLGRGELVPYGSYYQAGFLMEKPLAKLRQDMARLGVERADGVTEPEDHIAGICEIMAGLIDGAFGDGAASEQSAFFDRHIAPWAPRFFEDLESAETASFYKPVATVGRVFLSIESAARDMAA